MSAVILCQACDLTVGKVLSESVLDGFENIQLATDFNQLDLAQEGHRIIHYHPSSKRQKLHSEPCLLDELTTNLCSLFGLKSQSTLTGLDQIIQYIWLCSFFISRS